MWAVVAGLGLVVGLLAVLVVGLLRSHAEILRSLHSLGVTAEGPDGQLRRSGATTRADLPPFDPETPPFAPEEAGLGPAHDIRGSLPGGGAAQVAVTGVDHDTVLAFLSTGCATCGAFWDALGDPGGAASAGDGTRVVVVTQGPEAESEGAVIELAPAEVPTVMSSTAWTDYRIPASPFFLLVHGPSGQVVGEGSGQSWEQVVQLLQRSQADARASATRSRREFLGGGAAAPVADRIARSSDDDMELAP